MADKIVKIYGDARFLPRHDTLENWQTKNPILLEAEPSYVIDGEDGKKIKFGDGVTPWNDLPYLSSNINNGGDITVDQTYNPDSENAQSGKAVAEAVAKSGGGTTDYEQLENLPEINGVELLGNKSLTDLGIDIPAKTSELENDSGFIDDTAFENYYTKTEVDEKMVVDQTYDKNSQNAQSGKAVNEAIMLRKDLSDMEDITTITMDADTLVYTFPSFSDYKILYLIVTKTYKATTGLSGTNWFRFGTLKTGLSVKLDMSRTEFFLNASMPTGFTGQHTATNNNTQNNVWNGIVVENHDLNKPFRGTPTLTLANSDWAAYHAECGTVIHVKGVRR